jgi:hypothetical protein
MQAVETAEVEAGKGIVGDRYHGTRHRHVTVQSATELAEATAAYGADVPAALTRRNLTVDEGPVPREPGADHDRSGGARGLLAIPPEGGRFFTSWRHHPSG